MAESTKLRLVRCPKCENLLSEPEDSPFFQCGGCFTVLRSKIKDSVSDKSLEEEEDRTTTKPVSVNSCNSSPVKPIEDSSEEEASSDSDANVVVPVDVESDPANSILGGEKDDRKSQSGRIDSGLDRFKRRLSTTSSSLHDEAIEKDRASLLRQLDKLKEQLVQSCNVATPKQQQQQRQAPLNGSSSSNKGPPLRFYSSGNHIVPPPPPPPRGPSYYHHDQASLEPQFLHHNMMYREQPSMFQMHGRGPGPRPYFSGQQQYVDSSVLDVYPQQNGHFHHSSCSCYHCYHDNKYWRGGVPVAADAPYNAGFYPPPESVMGFAPPPPPHNPRPYGGGSRPLGRWHSNAHIRQLSSGYRHIRPLSGGAPFITCQNCFELLQLPKKQQQTETTRGGGGGGVKKLRCGACSCLMDLSIVDNKYIISTSREEEEEARNHRRVAADYTSDDYDLLGYVFHSLDDEQPRELQNVHSHSASLTEEEEEEEEDELSSGSVTAKPLAQVQDSPPLGENFGYCLINQDRSGVGSQSSRSEQEKVITLSKRQNSMKEVSLASEMEVSFNDYSHGGVSKDNHHHQQQQRSKKSGFASIVKKSFKDLTKSIQNDEGIRSNVSVNGHFLTERSMKKAEKQAGVIQPGNYWYDYRAGFWGVMGGPCLGILPPFIEELNYPLPENCAGGTTGVFVNGRELHRKDLDLLAARGLPSERDRSYIVDITGKVIDEDTGEELDCLGKLAPTIEKLKRGFGMRLPKRVPI